MFVVVDDRVIKFGLFVDNLFQIWIIVFGIVDVVMEIIVYFSNGLFMSIIDVCGNVIGMIYDGFDCMLKLFYLFMVGGGLSMIDVIVFVYDK